MEYYTVLKRDEIQLYTIIMNLRNIISKKARHKRDFICIKVDNQEKLIHGIRSQDSGCLN